ncbi:hypothetical protein HW555_003197 [Spodoptera exigua]|uniref:Uncharacterized protein n=1 Tax=Spodoptera exigua TaxID=7107 RepID=A0A835GKN4_SPOEX|nr:hypothetical protein HW555_003197 [Spodoptera exigua]
MLKAKMQLTYITLFLALSSASVYSQNLPSNAMTSLFLETILPKTPVQSMQNIMNSVGKMASMNIPTKINRRYAIIGNTPTTFTQNQPKTVLIQNSETVSPKTVLIQETVTPKTVLIRNGMETVPRQVIVRNNDVPKRIMVDNNDGSLRMVQKKGQEPQTVLVQPEFSGLQKKVLVRDNVLLSRPSPVRSSASLVPGDLSSVTTQPRGKLSRKFPLPPPTL